MKMARTGKAAGVVASIDFCYCSVVFVFSIGFGTQKWPKQARHRDWLVSIESCCCCYLVFVFSIGVWDTKVARTGTAARAASYNRVKSFLLNVVFVFSIVVRDTKVARTDKAARAASFNMVMLFLN